MTRRKRTRPPRLPQGKLFDADERAVGAEPRRRRRGPSSAPPRRRPAAAKADAEAAVFLKAVADAVPIAPDATAPPPRPLAPARASGPAHGGYSHDGGLDDGDGFVTEEDGDRHEGWVRGLDPTRLRKLRDGSLNVEARLDLHGLTGDEAHVALRRFLCRGVRARYRCLLVVHGRGTGSPDGRSVLRESLPGWLTSGAVARLVLAYASATPRDGGDGATYVLLRRERTANRASRN